MITFKQHLSESIERSSEALNKLVWYHGTNQPIDAVDIKKGRYKSFSITTDKEAAGWYAESRVRALGGEPYIVEIRVHVSKPLFTDETNFYQYAIQEARKKKRDCVVGPAHTGPNPPLNMMIINAANIVSVRSHKV